MQAALQTLLETSGVLPTGIRYISANLSVFATLFTTKEQLMEKLAEPFITGVDIRGTPHKLADDEDIWKTTLLVAWEDATVTRKKTLSTSVPLLPRRHLLRRHPNPRRRYCPGFGRRRSGRG